MNPFETARSLTSLWGRGQEAVLEAQSTLLRDTAHLWGGPGEEPAVAIPEQGLVSSARDEFERAWAAAVAAMRTHLPPGVPDDLRRRYGPAAWLGYPHELDRDPKDVRTFDLDRLDETLSAARSAAAALQVCRDRFEAGLLESWTRALEEADLQRHSAEVAEPSDDPVATAWSEAAARARAELAGSAEHGARLRQLVAAARAFRIAQSAAADCLSATFGIATREELDEVYSELDALRRRVRALSGDAPTRTGGGADAAGVAGA